MNKALNTIVKILILCGMAAGIALLVYLLFFVLPESAVFFREEGKPVSFTVAAGVLATLCVAGAEFIAWTLFRMMGTLDQDPFVEQNVIALRNMGIAALAITVCGLGTLFLHPVPLAVVAALPIGMCGLFSLVLSGVFQKAVAFKQENDLTV